jgi:hypothetical protein
MTKKRWRIVGILVVVAATVIGVIVALDPFPGNQVFSNVHGDSGSLDVVGVSASRRSPARFQGDADGKAATVQLGDQTAHVTTDRVVLPGGRVVPIPVGCKAVEIRETRDGMRVFLDGVES